MEESKGNFESFLGELLVVDAYHVFGFVSNTKIKTLLICNSMGDYAAESPRQTGSGQSLKDLIINLYSLYVKDLQNPLQGIDNVCTSPSFQTKIRKEIKIFTNGRE